MGSGTVVAAKLATLLLAAGAMSIGEAALLGLVEGLTEYLPVSSTGHLILVQRLLGIGAGEEANAFAISVQGGAILAVLWLYRVRVTGVARGLLGRDAEGLRLAAVLLVAFVPAAVVGLLFHDRIEEHLFGLGPVAAAWFVGGVVLLVAERLRPPPGRGRPLSDATWKTGLVVGLAQCLALWPGTSRSLVTIIAGVAAGLALPAAVELSFLLGVLTLSAATAWALVDGGGAMVEGYGVGALLVGFATAFVSALLAVRWFVAWISSRGLAAFGWYRIALAAAVGVWWWTAR